MAGTAATTKTNITIRLERRMLDRMEAVRDPQRFPTQTDFIREALHRMIREERRSRVRERMKLLAQDPEYQEAIQPWREAAEADLAIRLKGPEEGEE